MATAADRPTKEDIIGVCDQRRNRKPGLHARRARTENLARLPKFRLRLLQAENAEHDDSDRPLTRGECIEGERPCPWVSCKWHLYLDVTRNGIKLNFPDVAPDELDRLPDTCALDVADRGSHRLEYVAERINMVRERVRQVENTALAKLAQAAPYLRDFQEPE